MQEEFILLSPSTWNFVFLVARYVIAALLLAYLTGVYVKKLDIHTDIKGYVLEWRIDTFCDTEHVVDMKVKKEVAKEHIDWMYKLTSDRYSPQEFFEGIKGAGEEMNVGIIAI